MNTKKVSCMAVLESILRYEEKFWRQKTKLKWIKDGDGDMKFFHKVANGRKWKNLITKLVIDGEGVDHFDRIADESLCLRS